MYSKFSSFLFILINVLWALCLPKIKEKHEDSFSIVPFEKKYLDKINEIYSSELGKGNLLTNPVKIILLLCGNKMAFVMLNANKSVIGYFFCYFNLNEIKHSYIHSASAAMLYSYQKKVYGGFLYLYVWDWFQYNTWVKGISARYRLNNKPVKRLYEFYGYKTVDKYIKNNEEWSYTICNFNK